MDEFTEAELNALHVVLDNYVQLISSLERWGDPQQKKADQLLNKIDRIKQANTARPIGGG